MREVKREDAAMCAEGWMGLFSYDEKCAGMLKIERYKSVASRKARIHL